MDKTKQPGISFDSVMLVREEFYRTHNLPQTIKISLTLNANISTNDDKSNNELTSILRGIDENGKKVFELTSTFVGIFSVIKEQQNMNLQEFMGKNSSALIFPYIREHIASITQKAGMNPVIISPINVQALINASKKEKI